MKRTCRVRRISYATTVEVGFYMNFIINGERINFMDTTSLLILTMIDMNSILFYINAMQNNISLMQILLVFIYRTTSFEVNVKTNTFEANVL